jgi:hypothetical protein
VDIPSNQVTPLSPGNARSLLDPQLAAYELLRRSICARPPFDPLGAEGCAIPDEFKKDIEFGSRAYQISVYLGAVKAKFGLSVCEKIRTHVLLLSAFDASLESRLQRYFEAIRASDAEYNAGRFSDLFEDPALRYYAVLAILFLIVSGCPEERQRGLARSIAACLLGARMRAEEVFEAELKVLSEVGSEFEWSAEPGPFERQLQRQHNNPLFPATVRTISAGQLTDARVSDLRRMADFVSAYQAIVGEVLSPPAKMVVREANDLEKRIIDLIPSCMVLGDYFSKELKFLGNVSDSIDQELSRTTNEPGLRDTYKRYMALSHVQGHILAISVALPTGNGVEDFSLRSILCEDPELISSYAQLSGTVPLFGDKPLDSVRRIISKAIREGLDPNLGRQKLEAFRSGLDVGKCESRPGLWASLKRAVGLPRQK